METTGRQGGERRRSCPRRRPPQLATHTATLTDPHKPTQTTGGQESRLLTPSHAPRRHLSFPTATGLTGTPSPRRLLPSLRSPAQTPLLFLHIFPLLYIAPFPCTETGSSTKASALTSHPRATSTLCSTPVSQCQAGMEEEELLRSTDALGRRRSTAGASHR